MLLNKKKEIWKSRWWFPDIPLSISIGSSDDEQQLSKLTYVLSNEHFQD